MVRSCILYMNRRKAYVAGRISRQEEVRVIITRLKECGLVSGVPVHIASMRMRHEGSTTPMRPSPIFRLH